MTMTKLLLKLAAFEAAFLLVLAPLVASAQSYPAPTFNSLLLQNPLTPANGGTGATTSTGTGSAVLSNSPALTTPNLGTPSAVTLTHGTGLPVSTGISGLGTGVATGLSNAATGSGGPVLATSPSIASPTVTGSFTATGLVTAADLATQSANTIIGNGTGSTASPTALSVPSCSTSASALKWTSGSGFACNSSINAATLGGTTFAAPGPVGSTTASTGAFTTLTGTISPETAALSANQNIVMFPGQATDYSDNTITHTNSGSHSGTSNSAFSVASTVVGSQANGPINADYGMYLSAIKSNFLNSAALGEMDGLSIVTRQGQDDTDAILANVGGVAGFMGILEGNTNQFQAGTGTILNGMDIQIGSIETGLTGAAGSQGFTASAQVGTLGTGLLIQSAAGSAWTTPIQVNASGVIGDAVFQVAANGEIYSAVGIQGEVGGTNSPAGIVGELQTNTTSSVPLTTVVPANATSKSLTAGDWDVVCTGYFVPAGGTTPSSEEIGVSTTSATQPGNVNQIALLTATQPDGGQQIISTAPVDMNLTTDTTVYCVATAGFSGGTEAVTGILRARRMH